MKTSRFGEFSLMDQVKPAGLCILSSGRTQMVLVTPLDFVI